MPVGDPCRFDCGREVTHPKSETCDPCYGYLRRWSNEKTPAERSVWVQKLLLNGQRLSCIDAKLVTIGKSPFKWQANKTPVWKRARTSLPRSVFRRKR